MIGPCVGPMRTRRRHASTFTPLDLDLVWMLDATDASITGGTMTLLDGTGGSYSAQGTTYPAIATWPGTTRAALSFDGVNDHLDGTINALPVTSGAIYTLVYVVKPDVDASIRFVFDANKNAGTSGIACGKGLGHDGPGLRKKGVAEDGTATDIDGVATYVEHTFRVDGVYSSVMRINGAVVITSDASAPVVIPTGTDGFGLGYFRSAGLYFFAGLYGQMFLARGALTVPQRASLAGYMSREFGIS